MRIVLIALLLFLGACSTTEPEDNFEKPTGVELLYQQAEQAYDEKRYREATRLFEEVERQHPYSDLAIKAQLKGAQSSYRDGRYDDAVLALDRFVELHPGHARVSYAYYLKSLCYYEQISDVRRDQKMTELALLAFDALIRRFPDSKYSREVSLKRDLTLDHLAGKEMEIGRYYLKQGHVNAAINRFRVVVKDFQTTTHVPEALHRLVESYLTLGIKSEAERVAAVLGYNYPGNKWYERSYNLLDPEARKALDDKRGFWGRTVDSLLGAE